MKSHWWETVAIFLAIASLWPKIIGWPDPAWTYVMYAALALMVVVFAIRFLRLWQMGHPRKSDDNDE
jgi:hypothetical protein